MPKEAVPPLTDTAIARAFREASESGERRDKADGREPGLRIRLTPPSVRNPEGMKRWELHVRDRLGAMRRFPLGSYPDMGLSEARTEARRLRVQVRDQGVDPIANRRRDRAIGRAARAGEGTLQAVLDLYEGKVEGVAGGAPESWPHSRLRVERVFGPLLARPVAMLTARDLQVEADNYRAQQSASFAVRTIRPALKWLARRGYVSQGLTDLHQPVVVQRRNRVLSRDELAALLPVFRAANRPHAHMLQFLLLTAARLNEAGDAKWQDISLASTPPTWTIPRTKNGQLHTVPLSRQAVALLRLVRPESPSAARRVFCTESGKPLGNWDRTCKAFMELSATEGWHRHDLRRTAATIMGDLGVIPDIIEAALNHVAVHSRLASNYNQSRYRPQVADALQRLGDHLETLTAAAQPAQVAG